MKIGTKSILYGAHCFFLHPIFLFIAWCKLFGFPFDLRLWIAFFVHDLGYWGKQNMDGDEGERHVEFGAKIMGLFDQNCKNPICYKRTNGLDNIVGYDGKIVHSCPECHKWRNLSKYHSRFYAKKDGVDYSRLCVADKLAICLEPSWLYLFRVNLTGEINEYMQQAKCGDGKYVTMELTTESKISWFNDVKAYLNKWVEEHKDGKKDTWTPGKKQAITKTGVWQ